jgi:hypothetical protein
MGKPRRKQGELPGLERDVEHPEIEAAAIAYRKLCVERSELSKKEHLAQLTLLAAMHAKRVSVYPYQDENGKIRRARIKLGKETVVIEDEEESGIIEEVVEVELPKDGLIAQAAKAQADAGVAEDESGDVIPRDDPPAKKRGRKGKAKRE